MADIGTVCTGPEGVLLTGVGLYDDPRLGEFKAPSRRGIVFHDACWRLLEEAVRPAPVALQRLLGVCNSLPIPRRCSAPSLGHEFGGAAIADNVSHFPWEDRYDEPEFLEGDSVFGKNPYQEQPPTLQQTAPSSQPLNKDCFASLPQELCAAIAMYLPTADVLRARLVSRAFWPLFEARNSSPSDWRWLYRRTNNTFIGPGLRNRRRIWDLLQGVVDTLAPVWNELPPALPAVWSLDPVLRATYSRVGATGRLWGQGEFRTQSIAVPATLARMSVYTLGFGDVEYIVGMSLTTTTGDTIRLGYRSPSAHSVELTQVWGAAMVSIAVYTRSPPPAGSFQQGSRLRDLGVWYPTVPPRNLCLHEESFLPLKFHIIGYRPLFWCHFGGPGGKYLLHLTGISVTSCLGILRIRFRFDMEVPAEHRSFGRLKEEEEYEDVVHFSLDGPGGERIETIKMRHHYPRPKEASP
ncbi:hypothetical protein C8A03DRAFT_43751 [Achaetomium macrosporum]|uniref:F-box domain-containing protein n=1 Tax=Achaetomium macrosporum TaxID=79813 RepID=A0AAN7CAL4_9PEZI|nr:hypothetical protein C8A03DRAFT_43751 [Achaetomium macrosporum]